MIHDVGVGAEGGAARRPLTRAERALLDSLLEGEFDGVTELRAQARVATASTGCECGCVTVDLHVPDDAPVSRVVGPGPLESSVVDAAGAPIGGVLLFVADGRLSGLEVHSLDEPVPFWAPERVRFRTRSPRSDP